MTKEAVGETLQKGQKKRQKQQQKDAKKLTKKGKLAAGQGENAEISARKPLKIRKMPLTEHNKMLRKYKF